MRRAEIAPAFESWQAAVRVLVREGVAPNDIDWRELPHAPAPAGEAGPAIRVPRQFVDLARHVARA